MRISESLQKTLKITNAIIFNRPVFNNNHNQYNIKLIIRRHRMKNSDLNEKNKKAMTMEKKIIIILLSKNTPETMTYQ